MTDAEISRRLALAIGWMEDKDDPDVVIYHGRTCNDTAEDWCAVWHNDHWRTFDYRDPAVIWPIAERYNCFPEKMRSGGLWAAPVSGMKTGKKPAYPMLRWEYSDTAAKAVALAVIKAHEGAKE